MGTYAFMIWITNELKKTSSYSNSGCVRGGACRIFADVLNLVHGVGNRG